jgi:hypothetical protein
MARRPVALKMAHKCPKRSPTCGDSAHPSGRGSWHPILLVPVAGVDSAD